MQGYRLGLSPSGSADSPSWLIPLSVVIGQGAVPALAADIAGTTENSYNPPTSLAISTWIQYMLAAMQ